MIRRDTREMIREFQLAFDRPVNDAPVDLTVTERELLGKILLEEVLEYCTKGLGLVLSDDKFNALVGRDDEGGMYNFTSLKLDEGQRLDHIECADGLGDVNVVIHFCSLWQGYDLDHVTTEIHYSNMSKLGADGKPIINGETVGYRCLSPENLDEAGFDRTRPVGKILKGPNFVKPDIAAVIFF